MIAPDWVFAPSRVAPVGSAVLRLTAAGGLVTPDGSHPLPGLRTGRETSLGHRKVAEL